MDTHPVIVDVRDGISAGASFIGDTASDLVKSYVPTGFNAKSTFPTSNNNGMQGSNGMQNKHQDLGFHPNRWGQEDVRVQPEHNFGK